MLLKSVMVFFANDGELKQAVSVPPVFWPQSINTLNLRCIPFTYIPTDVTVNASGQRSLIIHRGFLKYLRMIV